MVPALFFSFLLLQHVCLPLAFVYSQVHRVWWAPPNHYPLVSFGSELPIYTFIVVLSSYANMSILVASCRGVLGGTGVTSTAPLSLAYPCKGTCEAARGRVWCQLKAKVPGNFCRVGDGLKTMLQMPIRVRSRNLLMYPRVSCLVSSCCFTRIPLSWEIYTGSGAQCRYLSFPPLSQIALGIPVRLQHPALTISHVTKNG